MHYFFLLSLMTPFISGFAVLPLVCCVRITPFSLFMLPALFPVAQSLLSTLLLRDFSTCQNLHFICAKISETAARFSLSLPLLRARKKTIRTAKITALAVIVGGNALSDNEEQLIRLNLPLTVICKDHTHVRAVI